MLVHFFCTTPGKMQPTKTNIKAAFEAIAAGAKAEDICWLTFLDAA